MTTGKPIDPPVVRDGRSALPALEIDWDRFGRYLEDSGLSEDDKRAYIETLWSIMVSFVDLGFRLSPVGESCGKPALSSADAGLGVGGMVECGDTPPTHAFEDAAADAMATSSDRRTDVV